jgi:hypothetical protein
MVKLLGERKKKPKESSVRPTYAPQNRRRQNKFRKELHLANKLPLRLRSTGRD